MNEKILKTLMKTPQLKGLLNDVSKAAELLTSFAQTYLGVYDEKGNQLEKGDRDYIFEALERIERKLEEIESKLK